MRSIRVGGSPIALAVIVLAVSVLAWLGARGPLTGLAAGQGAGESPSDRMSAVEAAISGAGLPAKLEAALGADFGGVWFDRANAQLEVGVTSAISRRNAEAVAAQVGLGTIVSEVRVHSTWSELIAAQERWNHRLVDLFESGEVKTAIVTDRNALQIELGSMVPASRRTGLEAEAATASVEVAVTVARGPSLAYRTTNKRCAKFENDKAYCDPTIVGGVTIDDEVDAGNGEGHCTAGPAVLKAKPKTKAEETETFILTAGHCIHKHGGPGKKWFAYNLKGTRKEIGEAVTFIPKETDIGLIKVNIDYWATPKTFFPVAPAVVAWRAEPWDPEVIIGQENPVMNGKVCISGQHSGLVCGTVGNTTISVPTDATKGSMDTFDKLAEVKLTGKIAVGDSGGPVVAEAGKNKVLGVQSSGKFEAGATETNIAAFQWLSTSLEKLKSEKGYDLALLTDKGETRHQAFLGEKYPVTAHGGVSGGAEKFLLEGGAVECKKTSHHSVISETTSAWTDTPKFENCTMFGFEGATVSMEDCYFEYHLVERSSEDNYKAQMDLECPEGDSIKLAVGTCKAEITAQAELGTIDLIDDTSASPSKDLTLRPTVAGMDYTVTQDGCVCDFSGTGEKSDGEYASTENITVTGQSPSNASEKIGIEIVGD